MNGTRFAGLAGSLSGAGLHGQASVQWGLDASGNFFKITSYAGGGGVPGGFSGGVVFSQSNGATASDMADWGSQGGATLGLGLAVGVEVLAGRSGLVAEGAPTYSGYDINIGLGSSEGHLDTVSHSTVSIYGNVRDVCK